MAAPDMPELMTQVASNTVVILREFGIEKTKEEALAIVHAAFEDAIRRRWSDSFMRMLGKYDDTDLGGNKK